QVEDRHVDYTLSAVRDLVLALQVTVAVRVAVLAQLERDATLEAPLHLRIVPSKGAQESVGSLGLTRDSVGRGHVEPLPVLHAGTEAHAGVAVAPVVVLLGRQVEGVALVEGDTRGLVASASDAAHSR